jgi:hypothetical protein
MKTDVGCFKKIGKQEKEVYRMQGGQRGQLNKLDGGAASGSEKVREYVAWHSGCLELSKGAIRPAR